MSHFKKLPEVEKLEGKHTEFPLEAYTSTALNVQSSNRDHRPSFKPSYLLLPNGMGAVLGTLIWAWAAYIIAQGIARTACFTPGPASVFTPPPEVCRQLHPTPTQFWHIVLAENEPPAMEQQAYAHVSYIRHLLAIPRRQDFALRGLGASINPEFTSPTYSPAGRKLRPIDSFGMHLPTIMLEEQVLIGDCWEFAGSTGRIGIHLAERINPTSMSVNYPDSRLLPSTVKMRAPHSITLWAHVNGSSVSKSTSASTYASKMRRPHDLSFSSRLPSRFNTDSYFLPILHSRYELSARNSLQNFVLDSAWDQVSESGPPFLTQDVVIEVESNWGGETTCLHHIGIHSDLVV